MLCNEQRMGFGAAPYRQDFVEFMILKKMGQNTIFFRDQDFQCNTHTKNLYLFYH